MVREGLPIPFKAITQLVIDHPLNKRGSERGPNHNPDDDRYTHPDGTRWGSTPYITEVEPDSERITEKILKK